MDEQTNGQMDRRTFEKSCICWGDIGYQTFLLVFYFLSDNGPEGLMPHIPDMDLIAVGNSQ